MSQPDVIDSNDSARPQRHYRHPSGEYGRVLDMFNRKGGTAKSTTAVNVAAIAADLGHDVLLVDLEIVAERSWLGESAVADESAGRGEGCGDGLAAAVIAQRQTPDGKQPGEGSFDQPSAAAQTLGRFDPTASDAGGDPAGGR